MKQIRTSIWLFLIVVGVNSTNAYSYSALSAHNWPTEIVPDIPVGHRTNDSTGTISVNNAAISQSIIPTIQLLNNSTITSDNCTLLVSLNISYLQFSITDSAGIKSFIAVQLNENSSGDFIFRPREVKELHISVSNYGCSSCVYVRDWGRITTSRCSDGTPRRHTIHFIM